MWSNHLRSGFYDIEIYNTEWRPIEAKKERTTKKINKEKLVEMEKSEKQNIAAKERQKLNTGGISNSLKVLKRRMVATVKRAIEGIRRRFASRKGE